MQEKTTIARPYAQAAFEQAREDDALQQWSEMLQLLGLLVSDRQMTPLLSNPKVSRQQLQDLIFEICADRLSEHGRNFVKILIHAERLKYAPQMLELFQAMRAQAEGKVAVEVHSAYPLDQSQAQQIAASMAKRLGKKVDINALVDESLIGGVIIRAGDSVIDASLRGRLQELKNEFI